MRLGDGDGGDAFTLAAVGAEFEKFRLEAEELIVERDFAVADVTRMEVADVAVRVTVAGLENDAVVAVADNDVEEYLALAVEAGGGAVAVGGVADFDLEGEAALVVAGDTEFPELVPLRRVPEGLPAEFADKEKLVLDKLGGAKAVATLSPRGGKSGRVVVFAFELPGAPAGLDVEREPLAEAGYGFGFRVVGKDAGVDNGVVGTGEHVVGPFALGRWDAADVGDGTFIVAGGFAQDFSHVAVLASGAFGRSRAAAELAVCLFEPEDILAVDVVAVGAELRGLEGFDLHCAVVNDLGAAFFPIDRAGGGVSGDVEFVEDLVEHVGAARAIHGLCEVPLLDTEAGADTPIGVLDAMADDAADSFPGYGDTLGVGDEDRLVDGHASHVVAADAKIAVGAVGDAVDALGHRVEDGA